MILRSDSRPCIYVVRVLDYVKIGWTQAWTRRWAALRTHAPVEPSVLLVQPGTLEDERALHALCRPWRTHGEWFHYCPEVRRRLGLYGWQTDPLGMMWDELITELEVQP